MTGINYVDETVNCVGGCSLQSAGCINCYACQLSSTRLAHLPLYKGVAQNGIWSGKINFDIEPLRRVLHWRKPKRIFLNSMSDTFHPGVTDAQINEMLEVIARTPIHTYLLLTKRPERMKQIMSKMALGNVWLGVTVENQAMADLRIPLLLQTPAAVRWISVEPMLEEIDLVLPLLNLDWVVIGCESGANRRECKIEWIESLVAQCKDAGVPVYVKQIEVGGKVCHDISKFPADLQVREVPK